MLKVVSVSWNVGTLVGLAALLIVGPSPVHAGQVIYLDTTNLDVRKIRTQRNPDCPVCCDL